MIGDDEFFGTNNIASLHVREKVTQCLIAIHSQKYVCSESFHCLTLYSSSFWSSALHPRRGYKKVGTLPTRSLMKWLTDSLRFAQRLPKTWSVYRAELISKIDAINALYADNDIMY